MALYLLVVMSVATNLKMEGLKMAFIQFKTKVRKLTNADDTVSDYIELKRTLTRHDCDLKPHQHTYYNSDLFPAMLNRAYKAVIGNREWIRLSDVPESMSVDTSKFLAVVTIELPENFR